MLISKDTKRVIDYLNDFSESNLRKKADLAVLLELGAQKNDSEGINRVIFSGKSLYRLYKSAAGTPAQEQTAKELIRLTSETRLLLAELTSEADEDVKKRFEKVYMAETNGALLNLVDLSHDLSCLKDLQTESRKSQKS